MNPEPSGSPADKKARRTTVALPVFLAKIVGWLRAGYPDGVPPRDYIPLVALLRRQLTDDEITLIADELAFSPDPASAREIKKAVTAITRAPVSDADINRVRARLAKAGWPLAAPNRD
jgi:hypothetical protein